MAPRRGRYFIRHRFFNLLFRSIDGLMALLVAWRKPAPARPVRKILVANGAHLGDVILTTSVLPALKHAFPEARIGLLIASWSQSVVREHPLVDRIHVVDHWRHSRAVTGRWQKIRQYLRTRSRALKEIRAEEYDVAVDLYFYFPNSIGLLWQAGIPITIGYTSAGFGPLLTNPADMESDECSMFEHHLELLRRIPGGAGIPLDSLRPTLPVTTRDAAADQPYLVMHMGSGSALKDWPAESWRALAQGLHAAGHRLVFTGSGARESAQIDSVIGGLPDAINLCGKLSWQGFVSTIATARLLIGVDSAASHVAGAVQTPSLVINHGMNNVRLWHSGRPNGVVMMHPVPCAPCHRKLGCDTMACIRLLPPAAVLDRVATLLESQAPG